MRRARSIPLLVALLGSTPCLAQDVAPVTSPAVTPNAQDSASGGDGPYRTPLAGKPFKTTFLGTPVEIEERDRGKTIALTLGAAGFTPNIGGNTVLPMFAIYFNWHWNEGTTEHRRLRSTISLAVNELDFEEKLGGPELLYHFENYTIPIETNELIDGKTFDQFAQEWGRIEAWFGVGYRWPLAPGNIDNDLNIQLFYASGYEYHERGENAPANSVTATDTYVHGLRLRARLDMFQRNLLELPHSGWAAGAKFEFSRRDSWRDFGTPGVLTFDGDKTRDYYRVSGYLILALPIPLLSERHRLLGYAHAGWAPHDTLDRYSAFRLGGGPIPTESNDLSRNPMPGAVFDQFPVEDYFIGTVEYRIELTFFTYLHLKATYALLRGVTRDKATGRIRLERQDEFVAGVAVTTGFLWDSNLYMEYTYDVRGTFRGGAEGHSFMLMWSKSF